MDNINDIWRIIDINLEKDESITIFYLGKIQRQIYIGKINYWKWNIIVIDNTSVMKENIIIC